MRESEYVFCGAGKSSTGDGHRDTIEGREDEFASETVPIVRSLVRDSIGCRAVLSQDRGYVVMAFVFGPKQRRSPGFVVG